MSKYDYLHEVHRLLKPVNPSRRKEVMQQFEDQFREAEEHGRSVEEVIEELGTPEELASKILNNEHIEFKTTDNVDETIEVEVDEADEETVVENIETTQTKESEDLEDISDDGFETVEFTNTNEEIIDTQEENIDPKDNASKESVATNEEQTTSEKNVQEPTKYEKEEKQYKKVDPSRRRQPEPPRGNNIMTMLLVMVGLFFLNIIVIGPFIAMWAVSFAFLVTGIAMAISSVVVIISGLLATVPAFISLPLSILSHPFLITAVGFLLLGVGGLLSILTLYVIRFFARVSIGYFKWNLRAIRGY